AWVERVSRRRDAQHGARSAAEAVSRVTLRSRGETFTSPVTAPRGEANAAPSGSDLENKLRLASRFAASPAQQEELISALRRVRAGEHDALLSALGTIRLCSA